MKKITSIVRNLDQLETYITDTSALSPNIFDLTFLPNEFTLGKNLIKFKGVPNVFQPNTDLLIEILDSNRNPIYHEVINVIESDQSRILAVYIYDTTFSGDCTITFAGTLQSNNNVTIPSTWANITNAKWSIRLPVNTKSVNTSEIIFDSLNLPEVTIEEQIGVRLDRSYESNQQFPTFTTGLIEFETTNDVSVAKIIGGEFRPEMVGGTLTVTSPINPTPISTVPTSSAKSYSSKIQKVLSKDFIQLENKFLFTLSQSLSQHQYTKFDASSYSISYEASPNYIATQHSESFALTQIKNLDPATGDISRIKLYINSSGTIGTYEQINDILLEPTEIFVDATGSILPDVGVGFFTSQSIIDQYWEAHTYIGKTEATAPTLTFSTSSLNNAVIITPSVDYRDANEVLVFQTKPSLPGTFIKDSDYKIIFDAIGSKNSLSNFQNPKISIFLSGSAFNNNVTTTLNSFFPVSLGKKIGELELQTTEQRLDDQQFIFNADQTGNGSLLFVIESGQWQFSDIRTLTSAETGYTENYTRFRTDIPVKHKSNNEIKFKIEYYNIDGVKSTHETIIENKIFEGGNRYIDGGFSMLTGSLTVADTLNSGVEIVGLQNTGYIRSLGYEGFNQATGSGPGGFLLFSGSALPTQTATSYEGVGLELVSDANNFFRYRTNPSKLDVHTETFFLGNPSTQFISGSNGQLEISSSGYHIQNNGDITASRFLMEGGTILSGVDILGSVTTNQLFVPAGTNKTNARAFISSSGEAGFVGDGAGNYSVVLDARTGETSTISGLTASAHSLSTATYTISASINTNDPVSFISSSAFKVSAGGIVTGSAILLGDKGAGNFLQFDNGTLTVQGNITADNIRTPATIGGSPSTDSNASSSITSDGFASFKSASIAGFVVNTEEIKSSNDALRLKSSGQITGSNVLFSGGEIGGFELSSDEIKSTNNNLRLKDSGQITGSTVLFTGGTIGGFELASSQINSTNDNLILKDSGQITGSDVLFDGGKVGGFTIDSSKITGTNIIIDSAGSIQTSDYASDLKGWKLSAANNGFLEVENAKIRGTLSTAVFEKETVNAVGGQLYVANSTTLTSSALHPSDQYLPTDVTMSVVNVTGFAINEILTLKKVTDTGFSTEYIKVISSSRADASSDNDFAGSIYVERGYSGSAATGQSTASLGDGPGAAQAYSGSQVIVSTGKIGTGFIRLNANPNDQATPYIDIVERTGSAIYDVKLKARLGDLSGLANSDIVFGSSDPGFGLATDNVFLQGGITATFGSIGGFSITNTAISSSNNNLILRSSGQITGSTVLFNGGDIGGFVLSADEIRSSNNNLRLKANGQITASAAQITGKITAQEGTIGGFNIGTNLESSGGTLNLKGSTGQITGSNVLFSGGEIGGFVLSSDSIKSSNNRLQLKDSGQLTGSFVLLDGGKVGGFELSTTEISSSGLVLKSSGQITGSKVLLEGGRITSGVTIEGSVTANAIRTPATIGGSPSTTSNASSSIDANGFAIFKSASIAGFEVTTDEISGGFIPASSSVTNTTVSASLQLDGSIETSTVSVDSFITNAGGAAFWEALRQSGTTIFIKSNDGVSYYNVAESSTNNFRANSSVAGATISINNGFVETAFNDKLHTLVDSGGSTLTAVSSSTTIFPETPAPLRLKSNGQITASAGLIAGTEITSTKLSSTTTLGSPDSGPSFELTSAGVISGSEAYIRRVTNLGSGNQVFPLLDSRIGLLDGRNLGRQLAESYTEHVRSDEDDGTTTFNTVATHVAQLLPYENTLVASFQMIVRSLGNGTSGTVRFRVETTANSGSFTSTGVPSEYDNFGTVVGSITKGVTRSIAGYHSFLAFGDESISLSIAESNQARFIRISVQLQVNPFNTQSEDVNNSVTLKGYSITATRALTAAAIGEATSEFPSFTS